jgi:hypothetical protein
MRNCPIVWNQNQNTLHWTIIIFWEIFHPLQDIFKRGGLSRGGNLVEFYYCISEHMKFCKNTKSSLWWEGFYKISQKIIIVQCNVFWFWFHTIRTVSHCRRGDHIIVGLLYFQDGYKNGLIHQIMCVYSVLPPIFHSCITVKPPA